MYGDSIQGHKHSRNAVKVEHTASKLLDKIVAPPVESAKTRKKIMIV